MNLCIGYDKAIDIAGDMFTVYPDKAIELVTKSASINAGENALDYALAKFSIVAVNRQESFKGLTDALDILRNKITNPKAANVFSIASTLIMPKDTKSILLEIGKFEKTSDKLLLLRQWVLENKDHNDVGTVIERAIDLAISDSSYSPNAAFYKDLSQALSHVQDIALYRKLLSLFDGQKMNAKEKGPTVDYICFQLNLASAELSKSGKATGVNRFIEIYLDDVQEISELPIRANALAWYYAAITHCDPGKILEDEEGLHELAINELHKYVDEILMSTADQYEILRGIFQAISPVDPEGACKVAGRLNIQPRRDEAIKDIISVISESENLDDEKIKNIIDQINSIQDRDYRIDASLSLLKGIHDSKFLTTCFSQLVECSRRITNPVYRCDAIIYLLKISSTTEVVEKQYELEKELGVVWEAISSPWKKIEAAFDIAGGLAKYNNTLAGLYIEKADDLRNRYEIETKDSLVSIKLLINLMIQSYHGLLVCNRASEKDTLTLARAIPAIPCPIEQAKLWGMVGCAYKLTGNIKELNQTVESGIIPLLKSIDSCDEAGLVSALFYCAPALWCSQRELCVGYLNNLSCGDRDEILGSVWKFISRKILPGLPADNSKNATKSVSYLEINEALAMLRLMEIDSIIYSIIEDIADSVVHLKHTRGITKDQIADLSVKLTEIINEKLPSNSYIKHDGYVLASYAQCGRLRSEKSKQFWGGLVNKVSKITNVSDRALVYSLVASAIPNSMNDIKLELVDSARSDINKIISEHDKMDRYELLVDVSAEIDQNKAKVILREAFDSMTADVGDSIYNKRRRLIDRTYNIDPSLPASLASALDDDPAREQVKKEIKRVERLNRNRSQLSSRGGGVSIDQEAVVDYANAAWRQLASLSAGRVHPIRIDKINNIINEAMDVPITLAYPLYAFVLESINISARTNNQFADYLAATYQAITRTLTFALGVLKHASSMNMKNNSFLQDAETNNIAIEAGDRESALAWIESWINKTPIDELYICDPYLDLDGLEILNKIRAISPDLFIWVLADINKFMVERDDLSSDDSIRSYWKRHISDEEPTDVRIILCGTGSKKFPVHDRWILSESSGLRIGTSYNSLGLTRLSEISEMSEKEVMNIRSSVDKYFTGKEIRSSGERLYYKIIDF